MNIILFNLIYFTMCVCIYIKYNNFNTNNPNILSIAIIIIQIIIFLSTIIRFYIEPCSFGCFR